MAHPHHAAALALALLAPVALAQDTASEAAASETITATPSPWSISLSVGTEYVEGSFADIPGDLNILRFDTDLTISRRIGQRRNLSLSFSQERSFYDFDGALGIVPADPADADPMSEGQTLGLNATFGGMEASGWGWFVTGGVQWAGEPGAVFDDSLTVSGGGGVTFQASKGLRLGVGLIAGTRIEESARVIPFPIVEWTIDKDWSLSAGSRGAGAVLTYKATPEVTLGLEVGFESREYRLDSDNVFADGVILDRAIPLAFTAEWRPNEQVTLAGRVGAHLWGEIEFTDSAGNRLNREDRDVALLAGVELRFRF
ncbi:MAG: hypothetical protein DHS20C14_19300 [Phycisphaeraceae bacterium]|nr:MAG: hypothetical protein DHS20C14_19300 [Phycisphaeraceae bacterium]